MVAITSFNENDTVAAIKPLSVNDIDNKLGNAFVVPNPSRGEASLQLSLNENASLQIVITDVVGKVISDVNIDATKRAQTVTLPDGLSSGMYLIKIMNYSTPLKTLKWIKE